MTVEASPAAVRLAWMRGGKLETISDFVSYLLGKAGRRAGFALLFLVLGSFTEGISILMLVPLLKLAGNPEQNFELALPDVALVHAVVPSGTISFAAALAMLVLLVVTQALFGRFKSVYMARLLDDFVNTLRLDLFESIGRAKWGLFTRMRSSDLEHAVNADIERVQSGGYYALMLLQSLVLLAAYTMISVLISPMMTLFAIVIGGLMFVVLRPFRKRAAAFGQVVTANRRSQHQTVSDFFGGMKVAKSLNVEKLYFDRLRSTLDKIKADNARYVAASTIGSVAFQAASVVGLAVFVYAAFTSYRLSLPEVVVLLLIFMRVAPRFMDIQTNLQQVLLNLPSFQAMRSLQARFDAEREAVSAPVDAASLRLDQEITVQGLSFAYADRSILSDVSFVIPARQVTALIGPSGSGKSTAADLLLGLIEPSSGSILIDDTRLNGSNQRAWRGRVAYVPQDVFLLHDTIAANLRLAKPGATEEELWTALRAAHAEQFVLRTEHGLESIVGDRGVRLSGGERQRIALARALLRQPTLLILDEATSALDWENQASIAASIRALRGSITILTIAHRPSMISFADWIVAIEEGKVVETGSYAVLQGNRDSRLAKLLAGEHNAA